MDMIEEDVDYIVKKKRKNRIKLQEKWSRICDASDRTAASETFPHCYTEEGNKVTFPVTTGR